MCVCRRGTYMYKMVHLIILLGAEMSLASQNMYRAIKDTYEVNWTGYTEIASAVEVGSADSREYYCRNH